MSTQHSTSSLIFKHLDIFPSLQFSLQKIFYMYIYIHILNNLRNKITGSQRIGIFLMILKGVFK
jgi:hypothetical protein